MNKRMRIVMGLIAIFFACLALVLLSNAVQQITTETVQVTISATLVVNPEE